jgi:hypothetical protein
MMINTPTQASRQKMRDTLASMPKHTTLYDLIAAIDAEAGPEADGIVTATVMHALKAYRVSCLGDFEGCQMVLDMEKRPIGRLPRPAELAISE